jgi:hypothetical protein
LKSDERTADLLGGLQPYVFAAYGYGRNLALSSELARASLGAGLRYRRARVSLDASVAQPILDTGPPRASGDRPFEAYLSLNLKLF